MITFLGDEAPLGAHRAGGEHALQVVIYFFLVFGRACGPYEAAEIFR